MSFSKKKYVVIIEEVDRLLVVGGLLEKYNT